MTIEAGCDDRPYDNLRVGSQKMQGKCKENAGKQLIPMDLLYRNNAYISLTA